MTSAKDIEGAWQDPGFESGLIQRCREAWETPIDQLSDEMLATFLRQKIALSHVVPEARSRVQNQQYDGTELYEGELESDLPQP